MANAAGVFGMGYRGMNLVTATVASDRPAGDVGDNNQGSRWIFLVSEPEPKFARRRISRPASPAPDRRQCEDHRHGQVAHIEIIEFFMTNLSLMAPSRQVGGCGRAGTAIARVRVLGQALIGNGQHAVKTRLDVDI